MFLKLSKNLVYCFYLRSAIIFDIDQNIVQMYNGKNVKLFYMNLIDIILEIGWYVGKSKKYDLILELVIPDLKNGFLFITFSNSHQMVGNNQIQLVEIYDYTLYI